MGQRRASKEVRRFEGARTTRVGAAALLLLLGACGGAEDMSGTSGAIPNGPGVGSAAATAGSAAPATGASASTVGATGATSPAGAAPGLMSAGAAVNSGASASPDGAAAAGGGSILPCEVSTILAKNCQSCHGATPVGGAPMSLMTLADLQAPAKTQPNLKVWELSKMRVHDEARPMPPPAVSKLEPGELAALDAWFDGGALAGNAEAAACGGAPATTMEPGTGLPGSADGSVGELVPGPGETCYKFRNHASTTEVDENPFVVPSGETYEQFYYDVPWPSGTVATAYATIGDNAPVLHHWLLFSTNEAQVHGAHIYAPLPTLIGTDPMLLAGWAVGGPNLVMEDDVGMELPEPGRKINVQWHFYNSTGMDQPDKSEVQICTVPASMRPNHGAISWLGTEDLGGNVWTGGAGMPPRQESTFTTTCRPSRGDQPITIIGFEPHMHRIGKRMTTVVNKMDGTQETIFDEPFVFGSETHYFRNYVLQPGETLDTSCTFDNDTDMGVPFGESTDAEMCYQFTFHYPARALNNGAFSLLGVTDTCW